MDEEPVVYVLDGDAGVGQATMQLLRTVSLEAVGYASAAEFFDVADRSRPGCIVAEFRLPDAMDVDLLEELARRELDLIVVFASDYATVSPAVRAMKMGAEDVLEKPVNGQRLIEAVQRAVARSVRQRRARIVRNSAKDRLHRLSRRERQVAEGIVAGQRSRDIAAELGLSLKTVECYRASVMRKTGAESVAELVRLTVIANGAARAGTRKTAVVSDSDASLAATSSPGPRHRHRLA